MKKLPLPIFFISCLFLFPACENDDPNTGNNNALFPAVDAAFGGTIDLDNLDNYANQAIPDYITKDNTAGNPITDAGATLGRVLFYDVNLSSDNSVSCSSCHQQQFAFSDSDPASEGVNGNTGRHSMRLINARFADEDNFFWDERANSLEEQSTMPIQDHAEMGFSGTNGDPDFNALITKMEGIAYYPELFEFVYGDPTITEDRMQRALAQFIRSIQSFDSKYDQGRSQVNNNTVPFPNYTASENAGKQLFMAPTEFNGDGVRVSGGAGCLGCHRAPEFDISPNSRNNGEFVALGGGELDTEVTRSPTLRDVVGPGGSSNGGFFHTAFTTDLINVINHYNNLPNQAGNNNLDNRLQPNGNIQNLALTEVEKQQLVDFLMTLTGSDVYTNPKWGNPF